MGVSLPLALAGLLLVSALVLGAVVLGVGAFGSTLGPLFLSAPVIALEVVALALVIISELLLLLAGRKMRVGLDAEGVLRRSPIAQALLSGEGRILSFRPLAELHPRRPARDLVGRQLSELVPP